MNALLQHSKPRLQDLHVPTEFIDDNAFDPGAFLLRQQHDGSQQRGEHAPKVDVAHQQHRRVRRLRHGHIHNIPVPQVDLRRTARAFNDYAVYRIFQPVIRFSNLSAKLGLVLLIFHGGHAADGSSVHDDLRPAVAGGLEQHGIHAHVRFQPGGLRLHGLCPADFRAVPRHEGIQRHVLRLKGRDTPAVLLQNAQQRRAKHALSHRRGRSLHHQALSTHVLSSLS